MVYGVYSKDAIVKWSPAKIFGDEIKVSAFKDRAFFATMG
jgi:D-arabinitol dehydrogenase (NADP+)